jgi:CHAT domain-containing protein/tetratricopeptide (TPR) repeat protein
MIFFFISPAFLGCAAGPESAGLDPSRELVLARAQMNRNSDDSTHVHFLTAAEIFRAAGKNKEYVQTLNVVADDLVRRSRFSEAESLLTGILHQPIHLNGEDSLAISETLLLLSYVASYNDRFEVALSYALRSLDIQTRHLPPEASAMAGSHFQLGTIYWRKGELDNALSSLSRARQLQSSGGDTIFLNLANTLVTMGAVLDAKGDYSGAMSHYAAGLALLERTGLDSSPSAAWCYHYMAIASRASGELETAVEYEKKALVVYEHLYGHDHLAVSATMGQLGDGYAWVGDYATAREYYEEALGAMRVLLGPHHSSIAEMERKLARLAMLTNDLDSALALISHAASIKLKNLGPNHAAMGDIEEDFGDICRSRAELEAALEHYRRAVDIKERSSSPDLDVAILQEKLSQLYLSQGDPGNSKKALERAQMLASSSGARNPFLTSALERTSGDILRSEGVVRGAAEAYDRSLRALEPADSGFHPSLARENIRTLVARARLFEEEYRRDGGSGLVEAVRSYSSAAEILGVLRKRYRASESKLMLQKEVLPLYGAGLVLSAELFAKNGGESYKEMAFQFAEESRCVVLAEALQNAEPRGSGSIPDSLLSRERQLSDAVAAAEIRLLKSSTGRENAETGGLRRWLFTARRDLENLQDRLAEAIPSYRELRAGPMTIRLASLQKTLPPRTTFLSYSRVGDSLFVFTVSPGSSMLQILPLPGSFNASVRLMRTSIKTLDSRTYVETARSLYRALIKPVEREIAKSNKLIIVPDGALHYVPFEVLLRSDPLAEADRPDFSDLPYLIRSHEIVYALSGTLYGNASMAAKRSAGTHRSFAGYAPVFPDTRKYPALAVARFGTSGSDVSRSVEVDGKVFPELGYSEEEVSTITAGFARKGIPAASFLQHDATKENFLATAGGHSIVHIATHGVVDERFPSLSGILFSPEAGGDPILRAAETQNLRLDVDLLVLGSCESGIGKLAEGEGVMALTRAFTIAGARNIAYSLWKVYDKQTSELMQKFYAHVIGGEEYSEALRHAKLEMISDRRTAFPLAWAGFVLQGR